MKTRISWGLVFFLKLSGISVGTEQTVRMECADERSIASICSHACGRPDYCEFQEGVCRSCSGTGSGPWIRFLKKISRSELDAESIGGDLNLRFPSEGIGEFDRALETANLLKSSQWMVVHSGTLWNFLSPWNSPKIRAGFSRLCGDQDPAPFVVFKLNPWGEPVRPHGVVCRSWVEREEV